MVVLNVPERKALSGINRSADGVVGYGDDDGLTGGGLVFGGAVLDADVVGCDGGDGVVFAGRSEADVADGFKHVFCGGGGVLGDEAAKKDVAKGKHAAPEAGVADEGEAVEAVDVELLLGGAESGVKDAGQAAVLDAVDDHVLQGAKGKGGLEADLNDKGSEACEEPGSADIVGFQNLQPLFHGGEGSLGILGVKALDADYGNAHVLGEHIQQGAGDDAEVEYGEGVGLEAEDSVFYGGFCYSLWTGCAEVDYAERLCRAFHVKELHADRDFGSGLDLDAILDDADVQEFII